MKPSQLSPSRVRRAAVGLLLFGAICCFGRALWIEAKAIVAQVLLRRAWAETLVAGRAVRPWGWADTYPVARLRVPRYGVDEIVLAGTTGRTLAFGPGHVDGSAALGGCGNIVLVGHRDTHFRFLRRLRLGDEILLETADRRRRFEVIRARIVHQSNTSVLDDVGTPLLTLITCYPFDAVVPGGPLRLVVQAREISPRNAVVNIRFRSRCAESNEAGAEAF
jgi:sortase A